MLNPDVFLIFRAWLNSPGKCRFDQFGDGMNRCRVSLSSSSCCPHISWMYNLIWKKTLLMSHRCFLLVSVNYFRCIMFQTIHHPSIHMDICENFCGTLKPRCQKTFHQTLWCPVWLNETPNQFWMSLTLIWEIFLQLRVKGHILFHVPY